MESPSLAYIINSPLKLLEVPNLLVLFTMLISCKTTESFFTIPFSGMASFCAKEAEKTIKKSIKM